MKGMFLDMLDDFTNISGREAPELILEKVASMSCKAAIKEAIPSAGRRQNS